jgi:hypothetical protein
MRKISAGDADMFLLAIDIEQWFDRLSREIASVAPLFRSKVSSGMARPGLKNTGRS